MVVKEVRGYHWGGGSVCSTGLGSTGVTRFYSRETRHQQGKMLQKANLEQSTDPIRPLVGLI